MNKFNIKNYGDSFSYHKGNYEKNLYEFLIKSKEVDKNHESFSDIKYEVKRRQVTSALTRVIENNNVVLLYHSTSMPRSFKVFTGKDVKNGTGKQKIYIDVTGIILESGGSYKINSREVDKFISYLVTAMVCMLYYGSEPMRIFNNSKINNLSTECFARLFTYVIDYMRLGGVDKVYEKTMYLSAMYYQISIFGKDFTDSTRERAIKLSGLSDKDAEILDVQTTSDCYNNIDTFVSCLSKILKADALKTDNIIEKWMYLFGPGTYFGLELYVPFTTMLTDAYVGAYINNQKTIEKIISKPMVEYVNELFRIGSELV